VKKLGFAEAFSKYDAKLANPQWAVSAVAPDGAIVMSCWQHKLKLTADGSLMYSDTTARWSGPGKRLLGDHLSQAKAGNLPVRLVVAIADDPAAVDAGGDASKIGKTFDVRPDAIGRVVEYDGERFAIEFRRAR
jgi:hypothetical protein